MKNTVLLLGGSGQLGTQIRSHWSDWSIDAPSHAQVDINDVHAVKEYISRSAPGYVINCAAFHNVDQCEEQPEAAFLANAVAVDRMAAVCAEINATFVTISTDYVFDGEKRAPYSETDVPHPLSVYGVSKYAGELLVQRHCGRYLILRTCGVYDVRPSRVKGSFIDSIIEQAHAGTPIRVVDDVTVSPTYARQLARALEALLRAGATGIVHAANVGAVSWNAFASEALRQAGIDYPIEAIASSDWKAKAVRPRYSALASDRLGRYGVAMPSWQDGIREYLAHREARVSPP